MAATVLPVPTGPHAVGNRRLFLTDTSRRDPFSNAANRLVSVTAWYPTTGTGAVARYLSANDSYDSTMALNLTNDIEQRSCSLFFGSTPTCWGTTAANTMWPNIRSRDTRAVKDAPVHTNLGLLPVVIFSPGFGVPGNHSSILAEELASWGWLVFTLSHTYESICVEWSNGVILQNAGYVNNQWAKCLSARVGDARFLLNQLPTLPNGIGAQADIAHVAMIGHSYGGTTGMETAYLEPQRIKAVCLLDGPVGYPGTSNNAQTYGIAQPVMLLSGPDDPGDNITTGAEMVGWDTYEATNHGPLIMLQVAGMHHYGFTDVGLLCGQDKKPDLCGPIDRARAMTLHPDFIRAFLDAYVLGSPPDPILNGNSPDWPEVTPV